MRLRLTISLLLLLTVLALCADADRPNNNVSNRKRALERLRLSSKGNSKRVVVQYGRNPFLRNKLFRNRQRKNLRGNEQQQPRWTGAARRERLQRKAAAATGQMSPTLPNVFEGISDMSVDEARTLRQQMPTLNGGPPMRVIRPAQPFIRRNLVAEQRAGENARLKVHAFLPVESAEADEREIVPSTASAPAPHDDQRLPSLRMPSGLSSSSSSSLSTSEESSTEKPASERRRYLRNGGCHRAMSADGKPFEHRTYQRAFEHAGFRASLPRTFDWRNVSGTNYCSPNRNQHIPVYCGSCWVFGALGALNDRFNIARGNRWPMTMLSPQEIIACGGKGNCNGGDPSGVYQYSKDSGLVEEGCNNYKAVNEQCDAFTRCGSCWPGNCFAIHNYTRYYVKDFGVVRGRENMMSEIMHGGPIACSTGATEPFEMGYTSGIYYEYSDLPSNHIASVTGWGYDEDSKTEYWIVRNSWGDAWGENGWFRVVTSLFRNGRGDLYNMGIERECYFADPDVSKFN